MFPLLQPYNFLGMNEALRGGGGVGGWRGEGGGASRSTSNRHDVQAKQKNGG